jgi:hypothetical protein
MGVNQMLVFLGSVDELTGETLRVDAEYFLDFRDFHIGQFTFRFHGLTHEEIRENQIHQKLVPSSFLVRLSEFDKKLNHYLDTFLTLMKNMASLMTSISCIEKTLMGLTIFSFHFG